MSESQAFDVELEQSFQQALADDPVAEAPPSERAAATPEADPPPASDDRGDGRNDKGQFVGRSSAPTPADPPPSESVAQATTPPPAADLPPAPPAVEPTPFRVRYNGGEHEVVPGAVVREDGLFVPKEHLSAVHEAWGRALKYDHERSTLKEQLLRSRQAESTARADQEAVAEKIQELFTIAATKDDQTLAEQAIEFFLRLRDERPLLEQRIALRRERAELDLQRQLNAPDPEQFRAEITQQVVYTAGEHLRSFLPALAGLTEDDQQTLLDRVLHDPERYAYVAGQRLSEEERAAGVSPGERVFDAKTLWADAQVIHRYRQQIIAAQQDAAAKVAAATRNATTIQNAAPPPPPPPSAESRAPRASTERKAQTYEEWQDEFHRDLERALE